MPALPNVPNVLKVVLSGTLGSQNWAIVLHESWSGGGPSVADLDTYATALEASWSTNMKSIFPSDVVLTQIKVTDLTSSTGNQGTWSGSVAGTGSGQINSGNAAVLLNYPSSFRYRGGHPRTYLPPATAADLTNSNTWNGTLTGAVTTGWTAFCVTMNTSSYSSFTCGGQCAVSYVSTAINPTPPHRRTTPIVMGIPSGTFSVVAKVASQRRRIGRK